MNLGVIAQKQVGAAPMHAFPRYRVAVFVHGFDFDLTFAGFIAPEELIFEMVATSKQTPSIANGKRV